MACLIGENVQRPPEREPLRATERASLSARPARDSQDGIGARPRAETPLSSRRDAEPRSSATRPRVFERKNKTPIKRIR
jgi:hypothetical protein